MAYGGTIAIRHRHARSTRDYPGERMQKERAIPVRLGARDKALRVFTGVFQGTERPARGATRAPRRLPEAAPNAPLLIRIVRYPYEQEVHRGRRIKHDWHDRVHRQAHEVSEPPMRLAAEAKGDVIRGNPLRSLGLHLEPLPALPSVEDWLRSSPREVN